MTTPAGSARLAVLVLAGACWAPGCSTDGSPSPAVIGAAASSATAALRPSAMPASAPIPSPAPFEPRRIALEDKAMGTHVLLATYTTPALDEAAIRPRLARALEEVRRLERLMTTWRDDSEISRINEAAGASAVEVGAETLSVIEKSLWASKVSDGVFDISFDAMRGLWKFDEGREDRVPSAGAIDRARKLIDWTKIKVDPAKRTVMLERPGMRISLGGIAKGYAVDAAARVLEREGIAAFFAQAGGDLYVRGRKPDGTRFKVGVRDPRRPDPSDFFAMLEVEDHAFSTAGDYERSFVEGGKRYHHIIDPRTGYPSTASRSVTVWAKDAFTADAVDDAVFILGPEKGLALVESIDDCGAVIVDAKNKVWVSKRLTGLLRQLREPTDGI